MTIFNGYSLVQVRALNWSKFGVLKMANLDQLIILKFARALFNNGLKPLFYSGFLTSSVHK